MIPKSQNYYFPAEWQPQVSTWLTFPHNTETWENRLKKVELDYLEFVKLIASDQKVNIITRDYAHTKYIEHLITSQGLDSENITLHPFGSNDSWCRDHGPAILVNKFTNERLIVDWGYNAWGGKYPPYDLDNSIPKKVANYLSLPFTTPNLIMEGGSVEFNGVGDVITTKACLLNKNRNPHLSQAEIESKLVHYYGVEKIHWLNDGIVGDDTDGHIDDTVRFVDEETVIAAVEHHKKDDNYAPLKENIDILSKIELHSGKSLKIIELPMPSPFYSEDTRLPASYANFLITNGLVIVPIYKDKNDDIALDILQSRFTNKKVVGLDSREIIWGLGSFHCLSQQEPDHNLC